ncbi:MAG: type IX secretion system sortase PorU [Saprospiraceae bacterium]|nr:type IX secretion system sortase PorU [Saprospiraceae bacterium]
MRNTLTILFLLTFSSQVLIGQEKYSTEVTLNWFEQTFDNIFDENDKIEVQTFSKAAFDTKYPEVPRYLHQIPLPGNGTIEVSITPIKTSPITLLQNESKSSVGNTYRILSDLTQAKNYFQGNISITPIRKTASGFEKLEEFRITATFTPKNTPSYRDNNTFTSVLSSGTIYKIPISEEGVYELTGDYMNSTLGIDEGSISSSNLQVFSNIGGRLPKAISDIRPDDLVEIPILVNDGGDGSFDKQDYIRFYAEGADRWNFENSGEEYSFDKNVYDVNNYIFLKIDGSGGKRIETINSSNNADYLSNEIDFVQIYEEDRINLLGANVSTEGTGKDWYGDYFGAETSNSYQDKFDISNVSPTGDAKITMRLAARGASSTTSKLTVDGQTFSKTAAGTNLTDIESTYARQVLIEEQILITSNSTIGVEFVKSSTKDEAWLDFIQLEYRKSISQNYNQLKLQDAESINYTTSGFSVPTSGFQYWNVTDLNNTSIITPSNGNLIYDVNNRLNSFFMIKDGNFLVPELEGQLIENQNIHGLERADLIILYHEDFVDAANRLAEHRRNFSNYIVETVDIKHIYNEFSGGRLDPTAVRDFARMISVRDSKFQYLLLLGDATYDYRNITPNLADHNFIPAYETDQSLDPILGYPSDDYYVLLSDDEGGTLRGAIDVAVGRIPVTTAEMANGVIDKIIDYDTNPKAYGDWRLRIAFAADDEDINLHVQQADDIAEDVEAAHPIFNQTKIYFDAYAQESTPGGDRYPAASEAINTTMQKGALVFNYLGHGGPKGWAQERVLKIPDIETWNNSDELPILITATCSFTGYDDPAIISAGEASIQKEKGGVVALLTTVRAVYSNQNKRLTEAVYDIIFDKVDGKAQTLGDIIKDAKNKNADSNSFNNDRKFSLIGDPSQRIALPKYNVATTLINENPLTSVDTLNALEEVTIEGVITDSNGNLVSDFNGNIFPTVYDKESTIETLRNDSQSRVESFEVYRNILFKGSASVVNGKFSFTFVVPKDINYTVGKGRISYYAYDGNDRDAAGNFNEVIIGGSDPNGITDNIGPEMQLFMNDESFVFGGSTDNSPTLLANLSDDLGINVSGTSIGHDIVAILDDDPTNSFILNEFYEANKDDHTSGKVRFPLSDLETGKHSITVKAWDVSNNSTEERLEFSVINEGDESLRRVYNYPNPFTTSTSFQFEHDLAGSELEVFVDIYTVSGKLVKTIQQNVFASGYRVDDIHWDAKDDYGSNLGKGLYLYKIKVLSRELNLIRESDFEKLVIL